MGSEAERHKEEQKKKGGAGKLLTLGCLLVVMFLAALVVVVILWVKGVGVEATKAALETTKSALEKTETHSQVVEKLGKPISMGGAVGSQMKISFPVSGPKGEGTVFVEASKPGGIWKIDKLDVLIKSSNEKINIIPGGQPPAPKAGG